MALLPDKPKLGDPKLPDVPSIGGDRRLFKILALIVAVLLIFYLLGGPGHIGSVTPPAAMP
ncbi:MAG: hypothetical protein K2Y42_06145 [Hyphomicrobium sp.]|jgi:hypothetical protein|uniref:hypothetical protein n=1 Tax=Hyphomicrobium sp. TaxID=82 RepID=UPI0025C06400|nr:hypothetical protein [Hyphomicrobium sp.]MBX9862317.1 hypothetical protein [Hyphomicrobium sp.]